MAGCRILAVFSIVLAVMPVVAGNDIVFPKTEADLGTMLDTDSIRYVSFAYHSDDSNPVTITKISTSCGCTIGTVEKDMVTLGFNPHSQIGTVDVQAFVYTGNSTTPAAVLHLKGNVEEPSPYSHYKIQMGPLRLRSKSIIRVGKGNQVERIACGNTSGKPLKISSLLLPPGVTISTDPAEIPPYGEADIVIAINSSLPTMKEIPIILDGLDCKPSERTIIIKTKDTHDSEKDF